MQYPVETWRVWSSTYPRKYTEDSEVCSALPAEHEADEMLSLQHQTPVQPYVMLACHRCIVLWLMRGGGFPSCPIWSQHTRLMCALVQKFPERLANMQRAAEEVRTWNAKHSGKPDEV